MKWARKTIERIRQALMLRGVWEQERIEIICSESENWLTVELRVLFGLGRMWRHSTSVSHDYMDLAKFDFEESIAARFVQHIASMEVDALGVPYDA